MEGLVGETGSGLCCEIREIVVVCEFRRGENQVLGGDGERDGVASAGFGFERAVNVGIGGRRGGWA